MEYQQVSAWLLEAVENTGIGSSTADTVLQSNGFTQPGGSVGIIHRTAGYVTRMSGGVGGGNREVSPYPDYEKLFEVSAWWQPDYEHAYKEQAREWVRDYPEKTIKPEDFKRMDLEITHSMARSGKFKKEDIEKALGELSPGLESRKPKDIEKYAFEMVRAVFDRVDVKKERERNIEYERTRERSRGMSREEDRFCWGNLVLNLH